MRVASRVIAILLVSAAPLRAQSESAHPLAMKHRNNCRLAVQTLITGEPHTKRAWARTYLRDCPEEAPPALVQEWRAVRGDTAEVLQLMRSSVAIRDARIYEQLRAVVRDRSRSDVVRVGAMHVLHGYVEPTSGGWFWSVRPPADPIRRIGAVAAAVSHSVSVAGPVPLGSVKAPVLELLDEIGASRATEPRTVWYAAAAIANGIRLLPS